MSSEGLRAALEEAVKAATAPYWKDDMDMEPRLTKHPGLRQDDILALIDRVFAAQPAAGEGLREADLRDALAYVLARNQARIQHEVSGYDMPVNGIAIEVAARLRAALQPASEENR